MCLIAYCPRRDNVSLSYEALCVQDTAKAA